jgi:hypothetical protein
VVSRLSYDGPALQGQVDPIVTENEDSQFTVSWNALLLNGLGLGIEEALGREEAMEVMGLFVL